MGKPSPDIDRLLSPVSQSAVASGRNEQARQITDWVGRFGKAYWPAGDGPTCIDLFAGCGGLSLGFRAAGFRVIAAAETDSVAAKTYHRNFPAVKLLSSGDRLTGDVEQIATSQVLSACPDALANLGMIIGGPPCQGFSHMGYRQVLDPRNTLYKHFVRLVRELRPAAFLFENVPGMKSMDDGRVFTDFMSSLQVEELGYSAHVFAISAAKYGVPQLRERLFVAGMRDKTEIHLVDGQLSASQYVTVTDALCDLPADLSEVSTEKVCDLPYASEPCSVFSQLLRGCSEVVKNSRPTKHGVELKQRLAGLVPGETEPSTKHRRLKPDAPAWTLRAGTRTRTACRPIHPTQPRVITVREAARLGSFPDEFWLPDEKAPAHMLIGNSVPPLLAYHLALQLAAQVFAREPD